MELLLPGREPTDQRRDHLDPQRGTGFRSRAGDPPMPPRRAMLRIAVRRFPSTTSRPNARLTRRARLSTGGSISWARTARTLRRTPVRGVHRPSVQVRQGRVVGVGVFVEQTLERGREFLECRVGVGVDPVGVLCARAVGDRPAEVGVEPHAGRHRGTDVRDDPARCCGDQEVAVGKGRAPGRTACRSMPSSAEYDACRRNSSSTPANKVAKASRDCRSGLWATQRA